MVELQRAISLVQRLKAIPRDGKWDAGVEHYQSLRETLSDIDARHPAPTPEIHEALRTAIPQLIVIEDSVDKGIREGSDPSGAANFNEVLNAIQADLEKIAGATYFVEHPGST